jgi:hypothetical protein
MRAKVFQLHQHVFLNGGGELRLGIGDVAVVFLDDPRSRLGMAEPAANRGKLGHLARFEQRSHGAAVRVAADNDVLHAEHGNRVLDGRCLAAAAVGVGGNDVAGVAQNE